MATVFLGRDVRNDAPVAIKVLTSDLSAMLSAERFRREIQVTTLLDHPNILPIFDSGQASGVLYYVMPYIAGESLRARLERERVLPVAEAIRIACDIAGALEHAHRSGIVHRDIKPENILLNGDVALLADFGIAHAVSAVGEQRLTQTGVSLGTPAYMSPEQATADRALDGRSDVYSLACVTYEMLGGQAPFTGPTAQAIIARHALENVPSLSIIRSTVPREIEAILLKALSKVAVDRYATAAEFAEALQHPETQAALVRKAASGAAKSRWPRWQLAAIGAVVVLALGAAALWRQRSEAAAPAGPEPSHVAVLYFKDASRDSSLGYLAHGLTDALIERLSAVPQLVVTSANGSALFQGKDVPRDSIARVLDVGTLVEGKVEQHGDQITVGVKLEDARGTELRHASFGAAASAPLALRDTLATDVARFLRERLGQEIELREERAGTKSPQAWAMLQRARLLQAAGDTARLANDTTGMLRLFARADSTLAAAERLDPAWVAIPVLRGRIDYQTAFFYSGDPLRVRQWVDSGLVQAAQAFRDAPRSADAFALRGKLRYWSWLMALEPDRRKAKALLDSSRADLETATQIQPNSPETWEVLSHLYYQYSDVVSAKLAARRAYDEDAYLSSMSIIIWRLFTTSFDLEQLPDAIHWCDVGAARFPAKSDFVECKLWLMGTGAVSVTPDQAWNMADSLVKLSAPPDRPYYKLYGVVLAAGGLFRAGLRDSAARVLDRVDDRADIDPTQDVSQGVALDWAFMGEKEKAISALARYLSANPARAVGFDDEHSWEWRNIHDDPRFQALVVHEQQ
jgi:serine/threonine-protein kinase